MYVKPRVQHLVLQHEERNISVKSADTVWVTEEPRDGRSGGVVAWIDKPAGLLVSVREIKNVAWTITGLNIHINPKAIQIFDPTRDFTGSVPASTMPVANVGFSWGDGTGAAAGPPFASVDHVYASAGTYEVTVSVNFEPHETILPAYEPASPLFTFSVEVV